MKLAQLQVGTKLKYWHEECGGSQPQSALCFAEVIKVGKVKVQVRDEFHNTAWKHPEFFSGIVDEKTYRECTSKRRTVTVQMTAKMAEGIARAEGNTFSEGLGGNDADLMRIIREQFPHIVEEYSYLPWGSY